MLIRELKQLLSTYPDDTVVLIENITVGVHYKEPLRKDNMYISIEPEGCIIGTAQIAKDQGTLNIKVGGP